MGLLLFVNDCRADLESQKRIWDLSMIYGHL